MRFFSYRAVAIYSLLIFVFSVLPIGITGHLKVSLFDKIVHGLAYCLLSFMTANLFLRVGFKSAQFFAFCYSFFLGILIEFFQLIIPYRSFEPADMAANFIGSLIGCLFKLV